MSWVKFFRSMIRRGPFDPRHHIGPPSPAYLKQQCHALSQSSHAGAVWGPPQPKAARADGEVDTHLFMLYFLITETTATFLWLSIAAHCLHGSRVPFLSLPMRFVIGGAYCIVKLALLEYAFHASLYFHISFMVAAVYMVLSTVAWGWHRGPLWFLYYMKPPRLFQPFSFRGCIQHVVYLLFQCVASPASSITSNSLPTQSEMNPRPSTCVLPGLAKHKVATATTATTLTVHVLGNPRLHIPLRMDIWNSTLTEHWRQALLDYGDDRRHRRLTRDRSAIEARLLVAIDSTGLVVSFYLMAPDATTVHALSSSPLSSAKASPEPTRAICEDNVVATTVVSVLELVLRYHNHSSSTRSTTDMQFQKTPYIYYATNPISSPRLTPMQRSALIQLLQRLNVNMAIGHEIGLRMLQCPNFLTLAPTKAATGSRHHRRSNLSSLLD
ncbi:hypothetical protein H257_11811 [Aphanomyces astaci]|uniref:Uncharacterized protein n=1 Tax=Aphanomyces astaci TaxID=112090 RepID=W4G0P8_APHAT|nr:hypothetical protein H257_11811 [Aphanomyces astaci]ETV73270.1 hypothetical protein H257_11811 [Aphanomyces astaci]|eukprot:XP_009837145.1 hypothetical protein H257_11811 [Aphanomyces astaci]